MEEVDDYESDPDDAIMPSALRRREASDDERSDGGNCRRDRTVEIRSEGESDGQGAYDEEHEDDDGLYDDEIEEEDELLEDEEEKRGDEKNLEVSRGEYAEREDDKGDGEKKKKENEPYAVPTTGAFYMHDDRFRENGRGRQSRMPGGRGLWESKDNRAWVHDRFEEMNLQDARYGQRRRNSRGHFRGRGGGKTRGAGRGYAKRNDNSQGYYEEGYTSKQNRDDGNHIHTQKFVRGRGPRRYEPLRRNSEISASQPKPHANSQQSIVNTGTGRQYSQSTNLLPNPALSRKHVSASSLNSASPPFYPSGSSKQEITVNQKRDAQTGNTDKTIASSMHSETSFLSSQSSSMSRGKAVVDFVNSDRLHVDDSLRSVAGKGLDNSLVESGSSLAHANAIQSSHSRAQVRNIRLSTPPNYQPVASVSQVSGISAQIESPVAHQRSQTQNLTSLRVSTLQVGQHRRVTGNQVSSSPHIQSATSSELGEGNLPPGSSKSQTQLVTKGKGSSNGTGRGSVLYTGAQVIAASGAMSLSQNDQSFSATPALLSVMQLGGQHPGGLGVPAVGMALPGYVAQPHLAFGNSEMTWVPVLAGAAGSLGASYPYIALDGSYYPRPSGLSSSSVSSRETTKPSNMMLKPAQRPEIVIDELGQRHNKPRRYSEMNFGQ